MQFNPRKINTVLYDWAARKRGLCARAKVLYADICTVRFDFEHRRYHMGSAAGAKRIHCSPKQYLRLRKQLVEAGLITEDPLVKLPSGKFLPRVATPLFNPDAGDPALSDNAGPIEVRVLKPGKEVAEAAHVYWRGNHAIPLFLDDRAIFEPTELLILSSRFINPDTSARRLAQMLGMSRNTVRKVLRVHDLTELLLYERYKEKSLSGESLSQDDADLLAELEARHLSGRQ